MGFKCRPWYYVNFYPGAVRFLQMGHHLRQAYAECMPEFLRHLANEATPKMRSKKDVLKAGIRSERKSQYPCSGPERESEISKNIDPAYKNGTYNLNFIHMICVCYI